MATSPIIRDIDSGDDNSRPFRAADSALSSGAIVSGSLSDGVIFSGHVSSGQVGKPHVASGAIASGQLGVTGTPDATKFLRDDFTWAAAGPVLVSGSIQSGHVASGAVQGFFGSTRNIASGTVGVFDLGSGAVIAGTVGSGAVVSGNIASGQVGQFHVSSGAITSGRLGASNTPDGSKFLRDDFSWVAIPIVINSGDVGSGKVASGAVQGFFGSTRHIASGTLGNAVVSGFDFASGATIDVTKSLLGGKGIMVTSATFGYALVPTYSGLDPVGVSEIIAADNNPSLSVFGVAGGNDNDLGSFSVVGSGGAGPRQTVFGMSMESVGSGSVVPVMVEGFIPLSSGAGVDGGPAILKIDPAISKFVSSGFYALGSIINIPYGLALSGFNGGFYLSQGRALPLFVGAAVMQDAIRQWLSSGSATSGAVGEGAFYGNSMIGGTLGPDLSSLGVNVTDAWRIGQAENEGGPASGALVTGTSGLLGRDVSGYWGSGIGVAFGLSISGGLAYQSLNLSFSGMPAVGVAVENTSGLIGGTTSFTHYLRGKLDMAAALGDDWTSGFVPTLSGAYGQVVFVGRSGGFTSTPGSGAYRQAAGVAWARSGQEGIFLNFVPQSSGGWITGEQLVSGLVMNNILASGSVQGSVVTLRKINSGTVGTQDIASGGVRSGNIASGIVSRNHLSSGTPFYGIVNLYTTAEAISGIKAVALASGTGGTIVRAERQSGLRLPAIGVTISGAVSGQPCNVVVYGAVTRSESGMTTSGFHGRLLYVGSGGFLVNRSGFMVGAASGAPFLSGSAVQAIGIKISGGVLVNCLNYGGLRPTSGLIQAAGVAPPF